MIYKGEVIEDREYVGKSQMLESRDENSQDFTLDDIEAWKELIIQKTEELKSKDVDFKNVTIGIIGDGFHYNPNGADDEPYMDIHLQWQELETDEEREKRIERKKKWIDEQIADEQRKWEGIEEEKKLELERALEVIKRHGYEHSIIELR